jgi:histidyl-tRNA synthetase
MDITATEFLKTATHTAEHFGFQSVDAYKRNSVCRHCKEKIEHSASATDKKLDALHGLLTSGMSSYTDSKMHALEEPVLFYSAEQVPRSGEVALSLQIFGVPKSIAEAILIQTTRALAIDLGYENHTIRINSLGDRDSNTRYTRELTNYLKKRLDDMPPPARELMKVHVLEALMYLIEKEHDLAYRSPNPLEHLSDPSRKHFREIVEYLDMSETPYEIDPKLIGHHECYSDALFALDIADAEGVKMTNPPVYIRGGRYSEFVHRHTKQEISAAGAVIVLRDKKAPSRTPRAQKTAVPSVYVVQLGFGPKITSLMLIDELRKEQVPVFQNLACDSLSTQLRDAEARGVKYTVIIGQKEHVDHTVILRNMHARSQEHVPIASLVSQLKRMSQATV